MKKNPTKPINLNNKKILLQRADRLGDLVLALPVIEAIKAKYPDAIVDLLCSSRNQQLITDDYPHIRKKVLFDLHKKPSRKEKKTLIEQVKSNDYDIYISLWPEPFYEQLGKRCNIPMCIGPYLGPFSNYYLSHPVRLDWGDNLIHESHFNLQLLGPLGIEPAGIYRLYPPKEQYPIIATKPIVLFFCSSGKESCLIPEKAIFNCVTDLLNTGDFHVVVTYGQAPKESLFDSIENEQFTHIKEGLPFNDLLSLIQTATIYCGPDTGPTHVASFLNKKCALTYRSWDNLPSRWGPVSDQFKIFRYENFHDSEEAQQTWALSLSNGIQSLSTQSEALSANTKALLHQKASCRCLWVCRNQDEYLSEKKDIERLSKDGWTIFVHIQEKGFFKQKKSLLSEIKTHQINTIISKKEYTFFKLINKYLPLQAKPRLTIINKESNIFD